MGRNFYLNMRRHGQPIPPKKDYYIPHPRKPKLKPEPRKLPSSFTWAELQMYNLLEEGGVRFRCQVKVWDYIVDFLVWPNVVIEVDGQHHRQQKFIDQDATRDAVLRALGFEVYHIRNEDL